MFKKSLTFISVHQLADSYGIKNNNFGEKNKCFHVKVPLLLWFKLSVKLTDYICSNIIEGQVEGKIEVTERRGRKRKQLLYDLKETRGYCKLKGETLDRTL